MPFLRILFALIALMALNAAASTEIPPLEGEMLDKRKVNLRKELAGKPAILVFGFSREAQGAMKWWAQRLDVAFTERSQVTIYQVANLESAPFFMRGVIRNFMRNDVPPALHSRFMVMTKHAKDWKLYLRVSPQLEDKAYFLVLDLDGANAWRGHAPSSPDNPEETVEQIRKALR